MKRREFIKAVAVAAGGLAVPVFQRRADWKVASRFVKMRELLLLGAYPSGAY